MEFMSSSGYKMYRQFFQVKCIMTQGLHCIGMKNSLVFFTNFSRPCEYQADYPFRYLHASEKPDVFSPSSAKQIFKVIKIHMTIRKNIQ